ncbi:MAG: hypothetical protein OEM19_00160 [Deltaproteobacteria bacterium]|nr:hypothetical protein [Deltaproteobacteria bacterium]
MEWIEIRNNNQFRVQSLEFRVQRKTESKEQRADSRKTETLVARTAKDPKFRKTGSLEDEKLRGLEVEVFSVALLLSF